MNGTLIGYYGKTAFIVIGTRAEKSDLRLCLFADGLVMPVGSHYTIASATVRIFT